MSYVIFEDTLDATEIKIHKNSCGYYKRQLENNSNTTIWHKGFDLESAINEAKNMSSRYKKGWKIVECCEN